MSLVRSVLVVMAALLLPLACKSTPEPVVPPAQTSPSVAPRFDGVYAGEAEKGADLLRFLADGRVLSLSTTSSAQLEASVRMLLSENERCAKGTYAIKDGVLRFVMTSKLGAVEYAGAIKDDKLAANWRSAINGAAVSETFNFVHVVEDGPEGAAKPPDPGDEPNAAVPPAAPGTPELTLIPDGAAWYCFRAPGASRCERKSAACEAARKTAVAVRKDLKVGRCAKQASAFCFTVVQKAAARGAASCSATEADCKAETVSLTADGDASEFTVSTCAKQ